jgi:hypothetical protein
VLLLLQSGDGTVSPVRQGLANVPSFMRRPFHLAWKGLRPGTFQVVKTTQSRGRTERTLLNALSQLRWHDEGCEVWFSLGENHEKVCRFGLHPLRNCIHAVISALRRRALSGRRNAADRRKSVTSMAHYGLLHPSQSGWRALMLPGGGRRMQGRTDRCKAKQGRRGKTALTCGSWFNSSTVLGCRPEREKNYLVTAIDRLPLSTEF